MSSSSTWAFTNFYPRPPRGGRPPSQDRRGTTQNFYPRPPRGGRLGCRWALSRASRFLSTPSARRATRRRPRQRPVGRISIHALREEGDPALPPWLSLHRYFYPRPPRGGRQELTIEDAAKVEFLSTPSARRATKGYRDGLKFDPFLSTPSARRATGGYFAVRYSDDDFYPRPPRGGRRISFVLWIRTYTFLSTPSARRATQAGEVHRYGRPISIHALREEGDSDRRSSTE